MKGGVRWSEVWIGLRSRYGDYVLIIFNICIKMFGSCCLFIFVFFLIILIIVFYVISNV